MLSFFERGNELAEKVAAESEKLAAVRVALTPFLESNQQSKLVEIAPPTGASWCAILRPWNDTSLALRVPDNDDAFIESMNAVILPQRFTALYHQDTKRLEVIWTAYELDEASAETSKRSFKYSYQGKVYKCGFGRSSDRLLKIAKTFVPLKISNTQFRNLQSFKFYDDLGQGGDADEDGISEPISFWVDGLTWTDDFVVEFFNNLNFYMSYYDFEGPVVVIHPVDDGEDLQPRRRYISGKFPSTIKGAKLDNNLLSFWQASAEGDSARRFQYYYRIIEYASFYYLESSARLAVKRVLMSPDAADDIAGTTEKLMAAFQLSKLDEYARFSQLLNDTLDPKLLWAEIKQNLPAYCKDIKFEGGFVLKALVSNTTKESNFCTKGVEIFTKSVRDIRNALSHGRDFKTASVIVPTQRNLKALQPWVHLIAIAAGQVVLFKDIQ